MPSVAQGSLGIYAATSLPLPTRAPPLKYREIYTGEGVRKQPTRFPW